jgi:hypothetical protein
MADYDVKLQEAHSEAARALGRDRGRRNETIAQRITAILAERDRYRDALEQIADGPDRHDAVQSIKKAKRALGHSASPRKDNS